MMLPSLCLGLWTTPIVAALPYLFLGGEQVPLRDQDSQLAAAPIRLELSSGRYNGSDTVELCGKIGVTNDKDEYFLSLNVGRQKLMFHVDTGSRTFWAAKSDYRCFKEKETQPQSSCNLARELYSATSFEEIPKAPFIQKYGSGEWARGNLGRDQVLVGPEQVSFRAILGAATEVYSDGHGIEAGILGLAGPGYLMGDIERDGETSEGFFPQLVRETKIRNIFSVALSRKPSPSWLELGGTLNDIATTRELAITSLFTLEGGPMIPQPSHPQYGTREDPVGQYIIKLNMYKFNSEKFPADLQYHTLLDTGFEGIIVTAQTAHEFNMAWLKNGYWEDFREFACSDPPPPPITIAINDIEFTIPSVDLWGKDKDGNCYSKLKGAEYQGVLGVPFFKNVVAVHNLETKEMEIRRRVNY